MRRLAVVALLVLAGCAAPSGGASVRAVASGGTCPDPDPARDGPYVDAIRTGNPAAVDAALARDPGDARARAARAILSGRSGGRPDPDQAACFAPYLT